MKKITPLRFTFELHGEHWCVEFHRYIYKLYRWEHDFSLQGLVNFGIVEDACTWVEQIVDPSIPKRAVSAVHRAAAKGIKEARKPQSVRRKLTVRAAAVDSFCGDLIGLNGLERDHWVKRLEMQNMILKGKKL